MNKHTQQNGFALLMAVIITSTLLLISFALSNISLKELTLTYAGRDSQIAFYAADAGVECALFWDVKNDNAGVSAFSPEPINSNGNTIECNNQTISKTATPEVPTVPNPTPTRIGGGGYSINPTSTFYVNMSPSGDPSDLSGPCAIVRIGKDIGDPGDCQSPGNCEDPDKIYTTILSRGYNICDSSNERRFERGIRVIY